MLRIREECAIACQAVNACPTSSLNELWYPGEPGMAGVSEHFQVKHV